MSRKLSDNDFAAISAWGAQICCFKTFFVISISILLTKPKHLVVHYALKTTLLQSILKRAYEKYWRWQNEFNNYAQSRSTFKAIRHFLAHPLHQMKSLKDQKHILLFFSTLYSFLYWYHKFKCTQKLMFRAQDDDFYKKDQKTWGCHFSCVLPVEWFVSWLTVLDVGNLRG